MKISDKLRLKVYKFLEKIPKEKVLTYKIIAEKFNLHPRTVGMIMNKNENPQKYPCYEVVASDGRLCGYALGLEKKKRLLENDGFEILKNKVVDFDKKIWRG